MKSLYPNAAVLVHPESPMKVIELADVVGSTSKLLKSVKDLQNKEFIVATDRGIFYKMQSENPDKILISAPTAGNGATCKSCAHCPWMQMNTLNQLLEGIESNKNEININENIILKAQKSLNRMLEFKK